MHKKSPLESINSNGLGISCHRGFEPRASTSGEWRASTALMALRFSREQARLCIIG